MIAADVQGFLECVSSGLSGKGRSCADGAVPWGAPGSLGLHLCCGARVAAASAGQDGAGDHGTREHMSKT